LKRAKIIIIATIAIARRASHIGNGSDFSSFSLYSATCPDGISYT